MSIDSNRKSTDTPVPGTAGKPLPASRGTAYAQTGDTGKSDRADPHADADAPLASDDDRSSGSSGRAGTGRTR